MKIAWYMLLLLAAVCPVAHAQECTSLAAVIGRQTQKFGDQEQKAIASRAQLCSAKYENSTAEQRVQIEAAYGMFNGGVNGSSTQIHALQEQECQSQFGSYWSNKVTSSELDDVSQIGAEVVKACLNSQAFRLVGLSLQDEGVSASYRYNGNGTTKIDVITASPQDIVDCNVAALGKSYQDSESVSGLELPVRLNSYCYMHTKTPEGISRGRSDPLRRRSSDGRDRLGQQPSATGFLCASGGS